MVQTITVCGLVEGGVTAVDVGRNQTHVFTVFESTLPAGGGAAQETSWSCRVFDGVWPHYRDAVVRGACIAVTGTVAYYRGQMQITVSHLSVYTGEVPGVLPA